MSYSLITYLKRLQTDILVMDISPNTQAGTYLVIDSIGEGMDSIKKGIQEATGLPVRAFGKTSEGSLRQKVQALLSESERSVWFINLDGFTQKEQWQFFGLTGYCSAEGKYLVPVPAFVPQKPNCDRQLVVFMTTNSRKVLKRILQRQEHATFNNGENWATKRLVKVDVPTLDWMV